MTTPNIVRVAAINGNTVAANVITYSANVVVNPTGSNQLYKIYSLHLCNYTGAAVTANVTIGIGTVANNYLVGTVTVPAYSTFIPITKDNGVYVNEGQYVQCSCSANSSLWAVSSYEVIT